MNCGKHRRPSIRRPTAARQRYEQSRYPKKPKPHATGTFAQLSAVRRRKSDRKRQPRGKTSPQRRKDRQIRAAPTKTDFPRFRHTPVTRTEPCRHFPAKINFSPARNRQSLPPHSRRIQTIKGLRTQPTAGSVPARRKRLLRKPNLRSPPLPATDSPRSGPDRQPPQLLPQPPQPEAFETRPASEVVRFSPNEGKRDHNVLFEGAATRIPPPKKGLKREAALQTRPPAANERPSNDRH